MDAPESCESFLSRIYDAGATPPIAWRNGQRIVNSTRGNATRGEEGGEIPGKRRGEMDGRGRARGMGRRGKE